MASKTRILTVREIQVLSDALDDMSPEIVEELLLTFPFEDMISISILNRELLRLHAIFLLKLKDKQQFYMSVNRIVYTLEFILSNLAFMEKADRSEPLVGLLLKLLRSIISQSKQTKIPCAAFQNARERILEVLTNTTRLKSFEIDHVDDCFAIISDMLALPGVLPLTTSRNLAEIAEIFKGLRVVRELALLTSLVFERFTISTEVFSVCACWLLLYGTTFLKEQHDDQILLQIMMNISNFYSKYNYIRNTKRHQKSDILTALETFLSALPANSNVFLSFCNNEKLKEYSIKILAIALAESNGVKWNVCLEKFKGMPDSVSEWPDCKNELFFEICAFVCRYSSPIWDPADVFRSVSSLVYSYARFGLSTTHLKAVCLVYSILLPKNLNKPSVILGDDLLITLSRRHAELDELLTCHPAQLFWILRRGRQALKERVLLFWLREAGKEEAVDGDLKMGVKRCGAAETVLEMLMDKHVDDEIAEKAIELIRSLEDPALSSRIAMRIPFVYHDQKLFRRLMMAGPAVPQNRAAAMTMCEFMSMQLVLITDEKVFTLACAFSKNLVVSLKTEVDVVPTFCKDIRTVKFLLVRLHKLGEEAAVEVLGLLKILVLVQKRNHNHFDQKLDVDFDLSLQGYAGKFAKCLDLLHLVVSKDLFLRLYPSTAKDVFLDLFEIYTRHPELSEKSLLCMSEMLKCNTWLASTPCTMAFVELNCSIEVNERSWQEFVVFLSVWIRILYRHPATERYYIDFGTVRNYLRRVPYLSQRKINNLLKMLHKLEKMGNTILYPLWR